MTAIEEATGYAEFIAAKLARGADAGFDWSQEAFDQQKARAEAAEAEVARLRDGLRHYRLAHGTRCTCSACDTARALLAEDGAARGEWFVPEGDRRCGVVHTLAHATCMKRRGHDGPHGTPQGTWIDGPWCDYSLLAEDGAA